jgi:ribosome biogenesis protein BMS1
VQGGTPGSFRATFEDKALLSDTVFLRAWVQVELPRFYNPVTDLLAPRAAPQAREPKPSRLPLPPPAADAEAPATGAVAPAGAFSAAEKFAGRKTGYYFAKGPLGLGYYPDAAQQAQQAPGAAAPSPAAAADAAHAHAQQAAGPVGWVGAKSVADLRRALGVAAPREKDSLYRPVERGERKFNPLKVPKALQASQGCVGVGVGGVGGCVGGGEGQRGWAKQAELCTALGRSQPAVWRLSASAAATVCGGALVGGARYSERPVQRAPPLSHPSLT